MFDDYQKKLEDLEADFNDDVLKVAKKNAARFIKDTKTDTANHPLVDTGAYKQSWDAKVIQPAPDEIRINFSNSMDYASYLEKGYVRPNGNRQKGAFIGTKNFKKTRENIIKDIKKEFKNDAK